MRRHHWNLLIKAVIIIAFGWFMVKRFAGEQDLQTTWNAFLEQMQHQPVWMAVLVICLMPCNWLLEVIKWRTLLSPGIRISWRRACAGVLSGITLSLFMPNRTGEFGGRILYVDARYRWQAIIASVTGSFAQNLVYIAFGLTAAMTFFGAAWNLPWMVQRGIWVLAVLVTAGFMFLYFKLPVLAKAAVRRTPVKWLRKPWEALGHLGGTQRKTLAKALVYSMVRYGIFVVQYVILLRYFGAEVPWMWLMGGVAVIYLIQTSIPLPPLVDVLARNEVGIVLWTGIGVSEPSIIMAGLTIWIINLAFPALFGLLAITAANVLRTLGYEYDSLSPVAAHPGTGDMDRTAP